MNNNRDSKAPEPRKVSFTSKERENYYHKAHFLRYLHKLEPGIENTLKVLLPTYETLFGKHQPFDRRALIDPPDFQDFYSQCFTLSSWQENNSEQDFCHNVSRYRVSHYLAKHNKLLKTCLEYRDRIRNVIEDRVKNYLEDPHTSEDIRKIPHVEDKVIREAYQQAWQDDDCLRKTYEHEDSLLESLSQFRNSFFEKLIKRFHLEKEWLCASAFLAVQEGKLELQMPSDYVMHFYPVELLQELHGEKDESSRMCYFPSGLPYPNELPLHSNFQFNKPLHIYDTAGEYEKDAVDAYRHHVRKYVSDMQQALKAHGYKLKRRNHDYSRIKWLVRWTVQGWTMNEILDEYTENESSGRSIDESTVWKAFKTFEKYDLPVRKKRQAEAN